MDPQNKNILPLESALIPYEPPKSENHAENNELNFDILELLNDVDDDQDLVLAATQVEKSMMASISTMKVMARKILPKNPIFSVDVQLDR